MKEWEAKPGQTDVDLSRLKDRTLTTRTLVYDAEATNILRALEKYGTGRGVGRNPFSYEWMLRVHHDMYSDVWDWAGEIRQHNINIGVDHTLIGQQLGGLVLDIGAWRRTEELLLEQTVKLHHRAVYIHPFCDGNGRWARLVANLWLRHNNKPGINWPDRELSFEAGGVRSEYLNAIKQADNFNYSPLMDLHARFWPG